jgi:hypothetical protein
LCRFLILRSTFQRVNQWKSKIRFLWTSIPSTAGGFTGEIQKDKMDHLNHFCSIDRGKLVKNQTLTFDMESPQLALVKPRRPEMVRKESKWGELGF